MSFDQNVSEMISGFWNPCAKFQSTIPRISNRYNGIFNYNSIPLITIIKNFMNLVKSTFFIHLNSFLTLLLLSYSIGKSFEFQIYYFLNFFLHMTKYFFSFLFYSILILLF